jgi:hypothetical protein
MRSQPSLQPRLLLRHSAFADSPYLLPSGTIHYPWHSDAPEISSSGSSHESEYLERTAGKQENWVEAEIRGQSAEARHAVRQDRAKPAVAALKIGSWNG